jgi:hypothetical protein
MFVVAGVFALELLLVNGTAAQPPRESALRVDKMTIEEKFLRLGYMKYEFYNRASNVEAARIRQSVHRTADDLRFEIEILKIGLIEEILEVPFSTLATPPKGEVLTAGVATVKEEGAGGETIELASYPVNWHPGPNPPEDFDVPFRQVMEKMGGTLPKTTRYITYEVNVSLAGKSRRYRALALFHDGFETSETSKIWFMDHISGGGFNMPARLLYENRPPVKSNPAPTGSKTSATLGLNVVRGGDADSPLVCSFESRKCCWKPGFRYPGYDYSACEQGRPGNDEELLGAMGVQSNPTIATGIAAAAMCVPPIEPESCRFFRSQKQTEKSGEDTTGHLAGEHWANFKSTGFCQVTPSCSAECGHDPPTIEYGDAGFSLTCHLGFEAKSQIPNFTTYNPANPPKCSEQMSVTYWACTMCYCVAPPFINIPWEIRQIWTLGYNPEYTCGET